MSCKCNDHDCERASCIMETLSKKWVIDILRKFCMKGPELRYSDLQRELPQINSRTLCDRLEFMEYKKLIERHVENTKPVTIRYRLTEKGAELKQIFKMLVDWSDKWS